MNVFLNTVLPVPVWTKIQNNRNEVNSGAFEFFVGDIKADKEFADYLDTVSAVGGPPFMLVKKIYDKIFFSCWMEWILGKSH